MKQRPHGVGAIAAATAVFAIAVVTLPALLTSTPAGADTAPPPAPSATAPAPPTMSIVASSTTGSYNGVGNAISFTYAVTNTGGVPLTNVSVADVQTAPAGPTTAPACQGVTGAGSCTGGTTAAVPPGGSATFTATYVVTQKDVDNGTVVDSATATAASSDAGTISATSNQVIVRAVQSPAIALTNSSTVVGASDGYTAAGQSVGFSSLVANTGNVTLDAVTLTDALPGLTGLSCPGTVLAPGANETCQATYTTSKADVQAGSITNTATVAGTTPNGGTVTATASATVHAGQKPASSGTSTTQATTNTVNTNTLNTNTANTKTANTKTANTDTANGNQGQGQNQNPAISLKKSATVVGSSDGRYSAPGQTVDYSYLITNTGNVPLSPVTLTDPMPGLQDLNCPDSALFPGLSETCTATYATTLADVQAGSITNTATATGTPTCGGPNVWATSSATVYAEQTPAISLQKSATVVGSSDGRYSAPGQTVDYSYLITNTGNVALNPVTLTDQKLGLEDLSCPDTALFPGISETCAATYTTTQADVDAGSITNTATATGTPPCGPNVTATSSATVYAEQSPSISVVKTANVSTVATVGQTAVYSFTVTNTGNVTLTSVDVTDAQAAPSLDSNLGPITCTTGTNGSITLAPGETDTCSATYTVTQADINNGSITDTATATGTPPSGPPVTGTSTLTLTVTQISVTKAVNPTSIVAGSASPIVYTITVTNTGTATTTDPITVTDAAPTGTTLVSGSPVCATGGPPTCTVSTNGSTITWTIPAGVAPGASYTLAYSVTLNASETGGDIITNTATFSGPSCATTSCSSNTVTTTVTAAPVTAPTTTTPTVTPASTAPASPPSPAVAVAFTGAYLSREMLLGLLALALGAVMVTLPRMRRRRTKGVVK